MSERHDHHKETKWTLNLMQNHKDLFHAIVVVGVDTSLNNAFVLRETSLATNVIMSVTTPECAEMILNTNLKTFPNLSERIVEQKPRTRNVQSQLQTTTSVLKSV